MTVTKFGKKRRPFGKLASPEFFDFDMEDFFENRLWKRRFFNDTFWNGKANEPALNIKETEGFFDIEHYCRKICHRRGKGGRLHQKGIYVQIL